MSTLEDIVVWPTTLPLPFVDYGGQPLHATLASKLSNPKIQRRSRFTASVVGVSVQWVLGLAEYEAFKAFFLDNLGNGAGLFLIELRYPYAASLIEWTARFTSGYGSNYQDGNWTVEADLDLVGISLAGEDAQPPIEWTFFLVMPVETPFATADNFVYCVHV